MKADNLSEKSHLSMLNRSTLIRKKAIKHSTYVQFLKKFLPFISFLLIASIFIWPLLFTQKSVQIISLSEEHKKVIRKNKVLKPQVVSRDKKGQILVIKSLYADHHDKDITSFDQPRSFLQTVDGTTISASSHQAIYNKLNDLVEYSGEVRLESGNNYAIRTSQATQRIKEQLIQGNQSVQAASKSCNIHADQGFSATSQSIKFNGNVILLITDKITKNDNA